MNPGKDPKNPITTPPTETKVVPKEVVDVPDNGGDDGSKDNEEVVVEHPEKRQIQPTTKTNYLKQVKNKQIIL
ncbi:hypothetical protein ACH0B5_17325 [Ureibacillus sp. 179-F W5.1 NHS]|mgnify:CR=1 FL=1|uniref:hypothetical protein n=1 Tax=Ureibacillus sp. 179-F W5.1 NHS TaxID=3374297 RepID=UPI0038793292